MIQKLNSLLRFLMIFLLILLALESVYFKFNDCDKCKFKLDKNYNAQEFITIYLKQCPDQPLKQSLVPFPKLTS